MGMSLTTKQAVLKTLAYSGIFNYPLTPQEIHYWLTEKKASLKTINNELDRLKIRSKNNFYYLYSYSDRKLKDKIAIEKWKIAGSACLLVQKIPSVLAVLVTGNLAMNNAKQNDDIDFLIITKKNCLWSTRLFVNTLLDFKKLRRHPESKNIKNKICLNMFLDENHLNLKDRNIYIAHEILQAVPLYGINTYKSILRSNNWVSSFLPLAFKKKLEAKDSTPQTNKPRKLIDKGILLILSAVEPFAAFLQKKYMKSKITRETINEGQLFFHPSNLKEKILMKYNKNSTLKDSLAS